MMKSIILLHGAIGASDQLQPLADALSNNNTHIHLLNFAGHGQKPFHPNGFSIAAFAEELKAYITVNHLEQASVFGYSMGGYVALYLAHQQPGLLGHIITLGTKFEWSPEIAQKEIKMLDAKTILEKVPKFAEALQVRHGANWEVLLQKTAELMTGLGAHPLLNEETFHAISHKVLIGLADHDSMVTLNETTTVFKQLKQAYMYMLPATKHPIETVNISLLARIIEDFLN